MSEFGSQHSSSAVTRPSLFEVLAEENLASSLRLAFRHVLKVVSENFPHRMSPCFKYFEEIYAVTDFVFQYIHMRTYGATFPEHFYGLKRIPDPREFSVSERRLLFSLAVSIVFPYFHLQLENLFKRLKQEEVEGTLHSNKGISRKVALMYIRGYPVVHFIWEITGLCYYMGYAVHKIQYHSPLLHLCGMQLVNSTADELPSNLWEEKIKNFSLPIMWTVAKKCVSSAAFGISIGAFFLQFLEWWHNREGAKASFSVLPIPPPPKQWPTDVASHLCPICKKPRVNATSLACSGFVFCYSCVFQYVKKNKKCPVTGYPASLQQLVRVYHVDQ